MSYDTTRDSEQLRILLDGGSIKDFIKRYNKSKVPASERQTIFLFPGGMASTLRRAKKPYDDDGPLKQTFDYREKWLTFGSFLGGARDLKLKKINGEFRDHENRIIVADGPLDFFGWQPYEGFADWCKDHKVDYFIFGWDWRRRLQHVGRFFIDKFLPFFREEVKKGTNNADPLNKYSLIGHSAGGMVVNWILRQSALTPLEGNFDFAITVATPFYGYAGQTRRWFEGESYLNGLFGEFKDDMIKTICSLPACYTFQFMKEQTFIDNLTAFKNDLRYPLEEYPSTDEDTGDPVDPYHPPGTGPCGRYPTNVGFDHLELQLASTLVGELADDLHPTIAAKFFNIRGDDGKNDTVGSTTWECVPPTDPPVIEENLEVPGDGTQPAWSTRHLGLAASHPDHIHTVEGKTVDHMWSMNSPKILSKIAGVLGVEEVRIKAMSEEPSFDFTIASEVETANFVANMQRTLGEVKETEREQERLRAYLQQFDIEQLRSIMRRALMTMVRHRGDEVVRLERPPRGRARRPPRRR